MRGFGVVSAATAAIVATSLFASSVVADADPIVIKGSKFFYQSNGTQFYIRGVAYQQDYAGNGTVSDSTNYIDPLANATSCQRDIPYLQQLGTNVVRVYAIDPTANHDDCMTALANAGIYVIADLSAPTTTGSINRYDPSWTDSIYARYASVVDAMQGYSNTMGFFAGNEVSNAPNNTQAAAFVKAAVRDMKAYIAKQGYRTIGVGYATDDDATIRQNLADYFNCGDPTDAIDFWGYNIYEWCGDSSYVTSGYQARTQEFQSYSVPVFFAEYGCNTVEPRPFTEVLALYGPNMSPVWSGGIVYMYFQEANDYGLVSIVGNTVSTRQDFTNLKTQLAKVHPSGVASDSYSPTNSPALCPSVNTVGAISASTVWEAQATPLPPTPNQQLCSCMYASLECVPQADLSVLKYGDLFSYVCGHDNAACDGTAANSTLGKYGSYGMCNTTEQLGWVFNEYYQAHKTQTSACDFGGAAQTQKAAATAGACSGLLAEAGTAGTGTVTSQPSGTGASGVGAGASAASSSGAANMNTVPSAESGFLPLALIGLVAAFSGMGMVLL